MTRAVVASQKPGQETKANEHCFLGAEYLRVLRQHHPEFFPEQGNSVADRELHIGVVDNWVADLEKLTVDAPDRFQRITDRPWTPAWPAWIASGVGKSLRHAAVHSSYKGLVRLKSAIDVVLYAGLIWELQPRTILEFGSLQGGSGLWLADQLDSFCGSGEVHSFDRCVDCVSPRAAHARLRFHQADLRDLTTLDGAWLEKLDHPWLVIDDAHENLEKLVAFMGSLMRNGDYYVIEDVFLWHPDRVGAPTASDPESIRRTAIACDAHGFVVDTKYTDAFGVNVTSAPNGWLRLGDLNRPGNPGGSTR